MEPQMRKEVDVTNSKLRHIVILCHPERDSFNAAIARQYCEVVEENGQEAVLRDLYRMEFDPVLRANEQPTSPTYAESRHIAHERDLISSAAFVVLIYPIWFGAAPAMLKGYVDRVLGSGFSFRQVRAQEFNTLLSGTHLFSLTTSGNPKTWLDEQGQWQSLIGVFDHYLKNAFSMESTEHLHFSSIVEGLSERYGLQCLEDVRQTARKTCSIASNDFHRRHALQR